MIPALVALCVVLAYGGAIAISALCFGTPADQRDDDEQAAALTDADRVAAHRISS